MSNVLTKDKNNSSLLKDLAPSVIDKKSQTTDNRSYRLSNIDMLRGLVIIIMALDHVRDFFLVGGVEFPLSDPNVSAGLYFTRWITHFCAPVFIFLAGTSVGLMSSRKSASDIGAFVFKRGLWLILVEIAIISTAWTFAPFGEAAMGGATLLILQVIWALGVSMIILAGAQFIGPRYCLIMGTVILLGHNIFDGILPLSTVLGGNNILWTLLYSSGAIVLGPFYIEVVYPLLPCIGLMLFGYGSASIFQKPPVERDKLLLKTGFAFVSAFILLRYSGLYGDPNPWQMQPSGFVATFFDFMNVSKYPASLLYLLVTLGPMAIICAFSTKLNGWLKDTLVMFGRVPFAFYVAHFYLIHLLSILFGMTQGFQAHEFMHIFIFYPQGYGTELPGVYLVWGLVITILYPFCKWVEKVKRNHTNWWLSYL